MQATEINLELSSRRRTQHTCQRILSILREHPDGLGYSGLLRACNGASIDRSLTLLKKQKLIRAKPTLASSGNRRVLTRCYRLTPKGEQWKP